MGMEMYRKQEEALEEVKWPTVTYPVIGFLLRIHLNSRLRVFGIRFARIEARRNLARPKACSAQYFEEP